MAIEVHGECAAGFERVRDVFVAGMNAGTEVGASVAVTVGNEPVVDLWAGHRDAARTLPWERDTIAVVHSSTKGMTSTCAHVLVDRGELDLDAPVARYWPQFAQAGKADIPVRWLLSHRAGVPAVREALPPEAAWDWEAMTQALAAQEPWWEPGSTHGYHAIVFGWLVGEVIRRVSGAGLGAFFRAEVAEPLGIDFHIGTGPDLDARTAEAVGDAVPRVFTERAEITDRAFNNPVEFLAADIVNSRPYRAAELGAVNGHGNARALARLYGALSCGGQVDGVRLMAGETIEQLHVEQSAGEDAVLGTQMRFGLGFQLPQGDAHGRGPRSFGHAGAGGSLGWADPDVRLGFGYVMNQMGSGMADPLLQAAYASL